MALLYDNGLVVAVIAQSGEEDTPAEQRDLQGLDIEVYAVCSPGVCSDDERDDRRQRSVEVGNEEDGYGERDDAIAEEYAATRRELLAHTTRLAISYLLDAANIPAEPRVRVGTPLNWAMVAHPHTGRRRWPTAAFHAPQVLSPASMQLTAVSTAMLKAMPFHGWCMALILCVVKYLGRGVCVLCFVWISRH